MQLAAAAFLLLQALAPWSEGQLDIHHISTGRGNATFFVLPDGTSLLVDAGAAPAGNPATPRPDGSRSPGEWIARYIQRVHPRGLDYALLTHFHPDHMGGFADVAASIDISKVFDRGWPDYDYPRPINFDTLPPYRQPTAKLRVEAFEAGRDDQIVLTRSPEAYPSFEIRNLTASGVYWSGAGNGTRQRVPPLESLADEDYPSENLCSLSFRLRYGAFTYFTGGDLTGIPNIGHPEWQNMEKAVASVVGPIDVHVVNHHGSIDTASAEFLAASRPRVHIIPSWSPTHPAPSVLKRMLSPRAYPGERDVFALQFREPTKAAIGPRANQVKSDSGHVVVRVEPNGASYRVIVITDDDESGRVKAEHGPYSSLTR